MSILNTMNKNIQLSKRSWIETHSLPPNYRLSDSEFTKLWNNHPKEKGRVKIWGKYVETPRWHASYGYDYIFSGQKLGDYGRKIPSYIKKLLKFTNNNEDIPYNQVLINWYENGHHYIGRHSDDETQLISGSSIFSLSIGAERKFRIRDKKTKKIVKDIILKNGQVVVMCGDMQKEFTHEIVKIAGKKGENVGQRINITFRKFK